VQESRSEVHNWSPRSKRRSYLEWGSMIWNILTLSALVLWTGGITIAATSVCRWREVVHNMVLYST
jgi:hypothetical protein